MKYDDPLSFLIEVCSELNDPQKDAFSGHIEPCFFRDAEYVAEVESILASANGNAVSSIIKSLNSAYERARKSKGYDAAGVSYL